MTTLRHCILTGYQFDEAVKFDETAEAVFGYKYSPIGKVQISTSTLTELMNNRQYKHPILAGICRNAFEFNIEPPLIDKNLLESGLKNVPYPKSFKEKCRHLLKFMYDQGGNDFKSFNFINTNDYPICFAEGHEEFSKIIEHLEKDYLVEWKNTIPMARGIKQYLDVQMTDAGIEEIEKDLPRIPMIGLVDQEISTGDFEVDEKINHAKKLFFHEPQTMDNMRSACETLSYVLEPLRKDLENYFKTKDISDFFQLVNTFDIRHNKESTKNLIHPEQLEWVFYTLLNTINTYTKLKKKVNSH